jgi:SAM-dependent methyltransferase
MNDGTSYRSSHTAPGYGHRYSANYAVGYYAGVFREIETPILKDIFATLREGRRSLLDFACGTGRITRLAAPHFERVVGVDVSDEMLEIAKSEGGPGYVCQDITKLPLGERFSVVTAFRFFLNAEQALRLEALAAIRQHMAPNGRLVCNIHMNSQSIMGIVYRMTRWLPGLPRHNTLSYRQFESILAAGGFSVERVVWYAATPRPGRFFARFLDRWVGSIEKVLAAIGLQGRFAHSFIVVARLANEPS